MPNSLQHIQRSNLLPVLCLWTGFLAYSICHAPIPGVNEPHYLTKSRHYWDGAWCSGDFFLESSNAHLVFYQTIGVLTDVTSLENAALIGRVLAWLLLAVAWQQLCLTLTQDRWSGCVSAAMFLFLASIGNFSGEWLVGGVEGKVFSYGFALAGTAALLNSRWAVAGTLLGLGVAFHPLVGLWFVVALGMAGTWQVVLSWRRSSFQSAVGEGWSFIAQRSVLAGCGLFVALSLPGVVPALQSVVGADPKQAFQGNYIQVFYRLSHHLDPMEFRIGAYLGYLGLSVLAGFLHLQFRSQASWRVFSRVVAAAGIIAVVGVFIGLGPRPAPEMPYYAFRMKLLKFYPFRLFDVVLPVLVAVQSAGLISERRLLVVMLPRCFRVAVIAACLVMALILNAGRGSVNRMSPARQAAWIDVCDWLKNNAAKDALVLTPRESWAFKWFAQRAEYVSFKDCPQDSAGIVEWNNRQKYLRLWGEKNWNGQGFAAEPTRQLHEETGITHIVSSRFGPFEAPVVYRNAGYRVYRID